MHLRIAVNFAGRRLQNLCPATLGEPQHIDRAQHRRLHRLDRIVLVVARSGRAGQVENLVDLEHDRLRDIVPNQIEIRPVQEMGDICLLACEKIVDADDVVPVIDEPLAQMRAEKTGPAGDENAIDLRHVRKLEVDGKNCPYTTQV